MRRLAAEGLEAWKQVIERLRGLRGQGRAQRVRGRGDEAVGEGEAARLDGGRKVHKLIMDQLYEELVQRPNRA